MKNSHFIAHFALLKSANMTFSKNVKTQNITKIDHFSFKYEV